MSEVIVFYSGFTQPAHQVADVCGCGTVSIVYGFIDEDLGEALNWCPRCDATWLGLEFRRMYDSYAQHGALP